MTILAFRNDIILILALEKLLDILGEDGSIKLLQKEKKKKKKGKKKEKKKR